MTGTLVLAATPIGNTADASPRLRDIMAGADVLAVEDTRRLGRLAKDLGVTVTGEVIAFYEAVEQARTDYLIQRLLQGKTVVVLTDAGMPSVSDPGYRLVAAAAAAGVIVTTVPGPSAVTAAIAVAGLPSDRFCFEGFPPRKQQERLRWFQRLAEERRTIVFFESPRRIGTTLAAAAAVLGGDRAGVVCRELTKTYEEVRRGSLEELAGWAAAGLLGEITVVLAGAPQREPPPRSPQELAAAVSAGEAEGTSRKEAIKAVASRFGVPKREVFDAVVTHRRLP